MANNADWLNTLNYVEFLRDVGRHFSVNRMLVFDTVKLRLDREQALSFLEFNYMIMQAYDFVELNKRHDCVLQMGGSDQWGNIVNGIDLGHRMLERATVRADHAAADHLVGRQDGQDRRRRRLAQCRPGQPLRLLAVLAQYRGRRHRALPQDLHPPAACRDRQARRAQGRRHQRGQEDARHRSDRHGAWARSGRTGRRDRARHLRARRHRARPAERADRRARTSKPASACWPPSSPPGSPARTAKCAAPSPTTRSRSTITRISSDKHTIGANDITPEGVIKLSLGKKKHVLLKPA